MGILLLPERTSYSKLSLSHIIMIDRTLEGTNPRVTLEHPYARTTTLVVTAPSSERPSREHPSEDDVRLSVFERHSKIVRSLMPRVRIESDEDTWYRHMMIFCAVLIGGSLFILMFQTMVYSRWCATAPGSLIVNRPDGSVSLQPLSRAQLEQFKD